LDEEKWEEMKMGENDRLEQKLSNFKKLGELKTETLVLLYVQLETNHLAVLAENQRLREQNRAVLQKLGVNVPQGQIKPQNGGQRPPQMVQRPSPPVQPPKLS
jgi:hypothetical protein